MGDKANFDENFRDFKNYPGGSKGSRTISSNLGLWFHSSTFADPAQCASSGSVAGMEGDSLNRLHDNPSETVEQAAERAAQWVRVIIEWADLDPRLGFRGSGLWGPGSLPAVLSTSRMVLQHLAASIERIPTVAYDTKIRGLNRSFPPIWQNPHGVAGSGFQRR